MGRDLSVTSLFCSEYSVTPVIQLFYHNIVATQFILIGTQLLQENCNVWRIDYGGRYYELSMLDKKGGLTLLWHLC
jgi:hypothetical protein